MAETLPYVNAYGQIPKLFVEIAKASVPPKFTNDFMYSKLGLKSHSYSPMIPLLKKLGFLDQGNVPTQNYKDYRDDSKSKAVMAKCIKESYRALFEASEYAYELQKDELTSKVKTVTGFADDSSALAAIVGTFIELCKLADFEAKVTDKKTKEEVFVKEVQEKISSTKLGISYTINLNLPATTEMEVFNAIFKSLKENILNE